MGLGNMIRLRKRKSGDSADERLTRVLSGEMPSELDDVPQDYVENMMTGFLYCDDLDSLKLLRDAFPKYHPDDLAVDEVYERCKVTGEYDFAKRLHEITGHRFPESTHDRRYEGTLEMILSEEDDKRKASLKQDQYDLSGYLANSREARRSGSDFTTRLVTKHLLGHSQQGFEGDGKAAAISDYIKNIEIEKTPAHLKINIYSVTDMSGKDWISAPYDEITITHSG